MTHSKLCQVVLGSVRNTEDAKRNPKGTNAAATASAGMLPVPIEGQHKCPGSAAACQHAVKQETKSSGPFLLGTDIVRSWISAVMKAEQTHPARLAETHLCTHGTIVTQIALLSQKYLFPYLHYQKYRRK